jgi:hypothetical protein
LEVCFWPFNRSEVPTLMKPVCLLLKFRFHVDIFQLFTTEINENSGLQKPRTGTVSIFFPPM